ncbi:MAG: T9SS type A sorting domain-containing protein [Saprospiraceae bacterium]
MTRKQKAIFLALSFFLFSQHVFAQFGQTSFNVIANGKQLKYPFAGGLNCPQFSEVDVNQDGLPDLFVFDRIGAQVLVFINKGGVGSINYTFAPEYADNFPRLQEWVLLRDFDGDGVMDIFAYLDSGAIDAVMVYKGYYKDKKIAFSRFTCSGYFENVISWPPLGQDRVNLYVSSQDIPDINDIDNDGDLDIITFAQGGGKVEFYKNISVEKGWGKDSLSFILADECWGKFYESGLTKALNLSTKKNECAHLRPSGAIDRGGLHAGSTVLTYDMDNDGDREILLGDISFKNINLAVNGGNKDTAYMNSQIIDFPHDSGLSVDLDIFPAPFMLDINNDGKKDFIAAPNAINGSEDQNTAWLYENEGTSKIPKFTFLQKNFLSNEMIDLGSYSYPTIGDITGDGLEDLVVGIGNRFINPTEQEGRLVLYKNIGSTGNPSFELTDDNWLNFKQFSNSTYHFTPTLGDLDNDGDLDLLVGEYNGQLFYVQNIAGAGKAAVFASPIYGFQNIDVGLHSTPCIVDMNNDGLSDLVLGERNGNFNYLQNKGSIGNPIFDSNLKLAPNSDSFGKALTYSPPNITGHSAPAILKFKDSFYLISGSETGKVYQYKGSYSDLYGTFELSNSLIPNFEKSGGIFNTPAFSTFNRADGLYQVLSGNARGGLSSFAVNLSKQGTSVGLVNTNEIYNCKIFPNPATNQLTIVWESPLAGPIEIEISDNIGCLYIRKIVRDAFVNLDIEQLPKGLFIIKIQTEKGVVAKRFIHQ